MTEYISREAALEVFGDIHPLDYNANAYAQQIKRIPAADVRENVKAHWVVVSGKCGKTIDGRTVKCSKCGNYLFMGGVNGGRGDANFCPNCGADMRKENDGNV